MFRGKLYQKSLHTRIKKQAVNLEALFVTKLVAAESERMFEDVIEDVRARTHLYLTRQQLKALEKLETKTDIAVTEHMRRAVDSYLEKSKEQYGA